MAQIDEQHKQIVLKADEICRGLSPHALNYLTVHDALMKMADFVASMPAKSPWVNVAERMPENKYDYLHEYSKVLCKTAEGKRIVCHWSEKEQCWWGDGSSIKYPKDRFTYWMYLPE